MKLAYIISRYPAISHTFILREVRSLRAQGVDVRTISIRRAKPAELLTEEDAAEAANTRNILPARVGRLIADHVTTLFSRPMRYLATLRRALRMRRPGVKGFLWALFYFVEAVMVYRECRRHEITHLHAHFANVASDVALLAACLGSGRGHRWTFSFTMHGPTEFYDLAAHGLAEKTRAATFVLCISDFCRSQLMALLPAVQWPKLHILHCAVDTATFAPPEMCSRVAGDSVHILCVGRLVSVKGQAVLLEATAQLLARGRGLHVTFVGDGPDRAALEQRARDLLLDEQVTFAGNVGQQQIRGYYAQADLFCLPSFAEGVPVVLMEAMAMGIPVVSTRIMGIPELIDHGHSGLLVSPGRVDQLAIAIEHLIDTPELCMRLARGGREKILAEFDLRHTAPTLAAILRRYLGDAADRDSRQAEIPARAMPQARGDDSRRPLERDVADRPAADVPPASASSRSRAQE